MRSKKWTKNSIKLNLPIRVGRLRLGCFKAVVACSSIFAHSNIKEPCGKAMASPPTSTLFSPNTSEQSDLTTVKSVLVSGSLGELIGVSGGGINSDWLSVDIFWLDMFAAGKFGVDIFEVGKFGDDIFNVGKFGDDIFDVGKFSIDILAACKFGVDIFVEGKFGVDILDEGKLGLAILVIGEFLAGKFGVNIFITGKLGVLIFDVDRFVFVMFTGVELGDGILSLDMLIGEDFGVDNT